VRALRDTTVLFVSGRAGHTLSRVERRWLPLMQALKAEGAQVLLVAAMRGPLVAPARELGISPARFRVDRFNIWITRNRLRAYLKRHAPTLAIATGFWADVPLRLAARDVPVTVVSDVSCGGWPFTGVGPIGTWTRRWLDRRTRSRVDAFTVDCAALAEMMAAEGVASERIHTLAPGVDLARVAQEGAQRADLSHAGPVVGYAGSLERSRGLGTLVAAAGAIRERHPDGHVLIAGDGPARLGLLPGALEGKIELAGRVSSVPAVLAALDVCVFPSVDPGVPASLLEAAALGRPIVASDLPGIRELFTDGEEIILVPPHDAAALADAVSGLLDDPERARAFGRAARARTVDAYSSASLVREWKALVRRLVA
jgi:glycosyltransferase involved in cell wall biosynthesis